MTTGEKADSASAGGNLPQIPTVILMFRQARPRALSRISNNLKDFRPDMRMCVIMRLSAHFPRVPRCHLSDTADWQAHFLGLRVQKTISCLTLITSQTPPANSARLLRVIDFSHLLWKRRQMSLPPSWYTFLELKSSELQALDCAPTLLTCRSVGEGQALNSQRRLANFQFCSGGKQDQ